VPHGQLQNGLGIAAMILGIVGFFLAFIVIGIIPAVLALIFGIIGVRRAKRGTASNRGQATSGLVLGIIGIVVAIAMGVVFGVAGYNRYQDCKDKYDTGSSDFDHCFSGDPGY